MIQDPPNGDSLAIASENGTGKHPQLPARSKPPILGLDFPLPTEVARVKRCVRSIAWRSVFGGFCISPQKGSIQDSPYHL